jgi:membrane-associated phospholipid phosphatase
MSLIRNVIFGLVLGGTLHFVAWSQDAISADGSIPFAPTESADTPPATTGETFPWNPPEQSSELTDADSRYEVTPGEDPNNHLALPFVKHLADDQGAFWTTPVHFHVHVKDLRWGLPFAGATAGLIASDNWISRQIPVSQVKRSKTISDYGTYSFIGAGAGAFLLGNLTRNDRMSEAGLLSGEAAINSTSVAYVFKNMTRRSRPFQANGSGKFFQGGSSFPSEHAAIAWSVASVMAHEYPGTLTKVLAYGLATTISATRVTGQQHFASDVLIGSALGWYFGRQVYRAHHDTELGGTAWGDLIPERSGDKERNPENMGSPYVPLDSWIYPALERLIALGYIKTGYLGIRPWTRMECARMLEETEQKIADEDDTSDVTRIYRDLEKEFSTETARLNGAANLGASLDSIYVRATNISGPPLRDGYHFGQTIINDYGRPYGEGFNSADGVVAYATAGPLAFSFRGEYQHASLVSSYSPQTLSAIAAADASPALPNGLPVINRFQMLDGTISLNFRNVQFSFGSQSQWLGPGESGPFLASSNAAPFVALKIDQVAPVYIPGISRVLGRVRTEFYIGQLSGHHWEHCTVPNCQSYPGYSGVVGPRIIPQPFIHGASFSFKPTANLEAGVTYSAMFGGPGMPVTFGTFFDTFYVHTTNLALNPGKRASDANLSYRVPGLREWLTVYLDAMTWDEVSPIGSTRANVNPGMFMPKLPKAPKLQLRAEGLNISRTKEFPIGWVYFNGDRYLSGYTNDENLIGSWIGRAGRGGQGWVTYSFSPRNSLQFGYRLQGVAPNFIGGGRLVDYSAKGDFLLGHCASVSGFLQYEQWKFPVLSTTRQSDLTASIQLTFYPRWHVQRGTVLP